MGKAKLILVAAAIMVLAVTGTSNAQMGVATLWDGGGIAPWMAFPITFGDNMVLQPAFKFESVSDANTEISLGASIEKRMREGTSPIFGAQGVIDIGSPDQGDGWTNFGFGVFLGGTASLAEDVEIVGQWGPMVKIFAKESPRYSDKTVIDTRASITLRWWVFGN